MRDEAGLESIMGLSSGLFIIISRASQAISGSKDATT